MLGEPSVIRAIDVTQTLSWADCIADPVRSEAKAFCERCRGRDGKTYRVRGLEGDAGEVRSPRSHECPTCGHALFWSRNYREVVRHEDQHPALR